MVLCSKDGERGSHEQLLAAKKEYWKLYETQFSGMNT